MMDTEFVRWAARQPRNLHRQYGLAGMARCAAAAYEHRSTLRHPRHLLNEGG